jgi:hypothetical protein
MKKPLTLVYYIQHSGEPGAGIRSFTDEVTVTVAIAHLDHVHRIEREVQ